MTVPTIDTFENDIVSEIKTKEATIGDLTSSNEAEGTISIGNSVRKNTLLVTGVGVILLIIVIGFAVYIGIQQMKKSQTSSKQEQVVTQVKPLTVASISPIIDTAIGPFLSTVTKKNEGYIVGVTSYEEVYAYMLRNESAYADELAKAIGSPREEGASSTPFMFTDITISNQNMRIGTSGNSTLVYSFVNNTALLIASSAEDILSLKGYLK